MTDKGKNTRSTVNGAGTSAGSETASDVPSWLLTLLNHQEEQRRKDDEERRKRDETQFQIQMQVMQNMVASMGNTNNGSEPPAAAGAMHKVSAAATRPSLLDVDVTYSKFIAWRSSWDDYVMLNRIDKMPNRLQKADLRCCLTEAMRQHIKCAMDITDNEEENIKDILDKIQDYLRQKRNVALDRVAFEERKQQSGETFDEYYVVICKLA